MTAGYDRYFQIARCFRDEDLRADRQPEFTQIDVEASFVKPEDIIGWIEGLMVVLSEVAGIQAESPFERLSYAEAMDRFGSDRPDLRWSLEISEWTDVLGELDSPILRGAVEAGGRIRGFRVPGASASRGGRLRRLRRRQRRGGSRAALGEAGRGGREWASVPVAAGGGMACARRGPR